MIPTRPIDTSCALIRPVVPKLETMLGYAFPVLDHGFLRLIDYMGNDEAIVQAARVSYGKGTKEKNDDQGLINYLMRHWHTTPFEMCEIKIHVKLPIFVARQWIRHRTANVNEYSARYSIIDGEFYMPEPQHMAVQSSSNKQGRGDVLSEEDSAIVLDMLKRDARNAYSSYEHMIDNDQGFGLARELARMNLPTNIYTQFYWKIDLHNLFHFLRLRVDSHAQYEIRVYADLLLSMVKDWVPMATDAFQKYQLYSLSFSQAELTILARMINDEAGDMSDFSAGEKREFQGKLDKMLELISD